MHRIWVRKFEEKRNENCLHIQIDEKKHNFLLEQHQQIHVTGEFRCDICNVLFSRSTIKPHQLLCERKKDIEKTPEPSILEEVRAIISFINPKTFLALKMKSESSTRTHVQ